MFEKISTRTHKSPRILVAAISTVEEPMDFNPCAILWRHFLRLKRTVREPRNPIINIYIGCLVIPKIPPTFPFKPMYCKSNGNDRNTLQNKAVSLIQDGFLQLCSLMPGWWTWQPLKHMHWKKDYMVYPEVSLLLHFLDFVQTRCLVARCLGTNSKIQVAQTQ